jgi:hypothetical protein
VAELAPDQEPAERPDGTDRRTSPCAAQASLKRTVGQIRCIPLSGVHNGQRAFAGRVQQPQRTRHHFARESNVVNGVGVATRFEKSR